MDKTEIEYLRRKIQELRKELDHLTGTEDVRRYIDDLEAALDRIENQA